MKMRPLDIVDGTYDDDDKAFSAQDTVNYLPTSAEQSGSRTATILKTAPGLRPAVLIGVNDGEMEVAGPVRGTYNAEGRFFAVAGRTLFQITTAGVSIPLGTIPGTGRVSFSHNQITGGNEVLVNNGNSGYIYNTVSRTFSRITDDAYPGGLKAVFINNRFIQIEPARRYVFNSDLANGLSYNALDRFTSEYSPDLVVSIESIQNQLAVFSTGSTEWFEDKGVNPQPFRSTGMVANKGAAGPFATAVMDNAAFMLGSDGMFYRFNGYTPTRISTKPIEQAIRGKNLFNVFTTVWVDSGYSICYWTFPDGETWGYDASTNKWHRRESYGFTRWRANSLTNWQNGWYAGDFQSGRLWQIDWDYMLEGDQEFECIRASGVVHDNQTRLIHERLELIVGTGSAATVAPSPLFEGQPISPTISGDAPDSTYATNYPGYAYTLGSGTPPYVTTIASGSLPNGLSLSTGGVIDTAVTNVPGIFNFVVRVTDKNGLMAEQPDQILIAQDLSYSSAIVGSSAPSLNVTVPAGAVGDLILLHVGYGFMSGGLINPPSGFTLLQSMSTAVAVTWNCRSSWYYRIADTDSSYVLPVSVTSNGGIALQVLRASQLMVDTSATPVISMSVASGSNPNPPLATPTWSSPSVVIAAYAVMNDTAVGDPSTFPYPRGNNSNNSQPAVSSASVAQSVCYDFLDGSSFNPTAFSPVASSRHVASTLLLKVIE